MDLSLAMKYTVESLCWPHVRNKSMTLSHKQKNNLATVCWSGAGFFWGDSCSGFNRFL